MKFFRLSRLALVPVFEFALCLPLCGQNFAVGFSGSIPIDTLKSMNDTLQVADQASRVDLLKRLGVDADVAEAAASSVSPPVIAIQPIRNPSRQPFGIVTLPCGLRGQSFSVSPQQRRPQPMACR